jgi:Domain of unknown function (DUF1929)/Kelch motif
MRRNTLRSAIVAAALLASGAVPIEPATADPASVGSWSGQVPLGIIGIHAALLPSGDVLFYELPGSSLARARVFDPETNTSTPVDPTLDWSVFCSGMSFLADGRLFATGGEPPRTAEDPLGTGIENAAFFDPGTGRWTGAAPMAYPRWYPSNVQMPDSTTLVMGGEATPTGANKMIGPMESYDPSRNRWTTLPPSANRTGLYPRAMLLPSGRVFVAGPQAMTRRFNPATNTWANVDAMTVGPRQAGGVVMLPGSNTVLTSGGKPGGKPVTATTETIDLAAATPRWRYTDAMNHARMHHNLVLLPDGSVLAVGGGTQGNFGKPVKIAERYDPVTKVWTDMAAQAGQRTYHSTALLLPDGRVISAGSNSNKPEQTKVEFFSPPYLFKGARPRVTGAPAAVSHGQRFTVGTPDAGSIAKVMLIRTPAVTHGWNFDQAAMSLPFTRGSSSIEVTAPANAAIAPVGSYMLFLLNGAGVPAVAPIVHVG